MVQGDKVHLRIGCGWPVNFLHLAVLAVRHFWRDLFTFGFRWLAGCGYISANTVLEKFLKMFDRLFFWPVTLFHQIDSAVGFRCWRDHKNNGDGLLV